MKDPIIDLLNVIADRVRIIDKDFRIIFENRTHKKVRDDKGYWKMVEKFVEEHSDASFTHSICPRCLKKADPELFDEYEKEMAGTERKLFNKQQS